MATAAPSSKGRKVLIGCGVGCGGLLLLGIGSCIGFQVWIDRPGDLLEPEQLFGADTTGYLEWELSDQDPATRTFVETLLESAKTDPSRLEGMPAVISRMIADRQDKANRENIEQLLPMVAVWTMHPGATGLDDLHLISLSIERLGNRMTFVDWVFSLTFRFSDEIETVRYRGERLYEVHTGPDRYTFFIHDQDAFFTTSLDNAKRALDRLAGEPAESDGGGPAVPAGSGAAPGELERLFGEMPDTALRGVISNATGSLDGIWDLISGADDDEVERQRAEQSAEIPMERPDWSKIRIVSLSGGFSGPKSFAGVIVFHCVSAEWASANAGRLVNALRTDYRHAHLPVETKINVIEDRVQVRFQMDDVLSFLDEL